MLVHDLQTKEKFIFICEKWLAIERGDGKISRLLPVAGEKQTTQFKYLLSKETKKKLSDGHLWFSIFIRPTQSSFTRLDRLTCCFVLLLMTMLLNILYYDQAEVDKDSTDGIKIGPATITSKQVEIIIIK